jgi:ribosomal protein S18 acetylase RimI-like enzyme
MMGYILGKLLAPPYENDLDSSLYCMCSGKAEGQNKLWHGHVTAVTVSPEYRRLGVASNLMAFLEEVSQDIYNAYFVDLFVRVSNQLAQVMYNGLQYTVYRQVSKCFVCLIHVCDFYKSFFDHPTSRRFSVTILEKKMPMI